MATPPPSTPDGGATPSRSAQPPQPPQPAPPVAPGSSPPTSAPSGPSATGKRPRRWRRRLRRLLLAIVLMPVLVAVVLAAIVGVLLGTAWGRAQVASIVESVVSEQVLVGDLTIERIDALWPGQLDVSGVVVTDGEGREAVVVERLTASYLLRPLLEQRVEVGSIAIDGLDVDGRISADGGLNLAELVPPSEPSPPSDAPGWHVSLPDARLSGGRFVLRDARNDDARLVVVEDLDLAAAFTMDPTGAIRVELPSLQALVAPPTDLDARLTTTIDRLALSMDSASLTATLQRVAIDETAVTDLEASMDFDPTGARAFERVHMRFPDLVIDPADAEQFVQDVTLRAPVRVEAQIDGPPEALLASVIATSGDATVDVGLELDITDPATPRYLGTIELARFRPAKWIAMDDLDVDVSALVVIDGAGITPSDVRGRVRVDVGPSRVMGQSLEGAFVSAVFAWGEVQLRTLQAWADGVTIDASGEADLKGRIEAEVSIDVADLARLRQRAGRKERLSGGIAIDFALRGTAPPEDLADVDTSDVLALIDEWLPRFEARLAVRADAVAVDDYGLGRLELGLAVPQSEVPAIDVDLDVRDARVPGVVALNRVTLGAEVRDRDLSASVSVTESAPESRTVEADLDLAWRDPDVRLTVDRLIVGVAPVVAELRRPLRAVATLDDTFAPARASVDPFTIAINDMPIDVSGAWSNTGAIRAEVTTAPVDLAALSRIVDGAPTVGGTVEVSARVRGTLARPEGDVTLRLRDGAFEPVDGLDLDTALVYSGRRLRLGLDASLSGDPLVSIDTGAVGVPLVVDLERGIFDVPTDQPFELSAELHRVDLGDVRRFVPELEQMNVRGAVTANIDVDGSLDDPDANVVVRLERLGAQVPLGDDVLEVSEVDLSIGGKYGGDDGGLDGALSLEAFGREILDVQLRSDADVRPVVEGEITVESWLADLRGDLDATVGPVEVTDLPGALQRMLPVTGGRFDGTAHLAGGVGGGHLSAMLVGRELVLDGAPPVSTVVQLVAGDTTSVDLRVALGDDRPVDVWRDGGTFEGQADLLDGRVDAAAVQLLVEHEQGLRDVLVSGLDLGAPLAARLHVPGLPLALVATTEGDDPVAGRVRGYADVTGSVLDPRLGGRWTLRDLPLADGSSGLFAVELGYEDQRFDASARVCSGDTQSVYATASTFVANPLVAPDGTLMIPDVMALPLDVDIDATGAELAAVLPAAIAGGLIEDPIGAVDRMTMNLDGTLADPVFDGVLEIHGAELGVVPVGRRFEDVTVLATFSNDAIEIETLELYDGASRVRGSGEVELVDLMPSRLDLDLRLRDFLIADPTGAGVYVDGRIGVEGAQQGDVLVTNVTLRGLTVAVPPSAVASGAGPTSPSGDVLFIGEDVDLSQVGLAEPVRLGESETSAPSSAMDVDVHVRTAGRNTIEGDVAGTRFEIVFETNLTARLREEGMRLGGQIELPEGQVTVLSKPFEITRGFITFNSELNVIDPVVDVRADYFLSSDVAANLEPPSGERASIFLVVDGPLSALSGAQGRIASFQSDPVLSDQDIISVLINGRPRGEDASGDADQQALAAAGSLLLGLLGNQLAGGAGIDTLRIESDSEAEGGIARVEGGKYISPDFYLSGAYIYDEEAGFEIRLEWIIARFRRASLRATLAGTTLRTGAVEMLYQFTRPGRTRAAPDPVP